MKRLSGILRTRSSSCVIVTTAGFLSMTWKTIMSSAQRQLSLAATMNYGNGIIYKGLKMNCDIVSEHFGIAMSENEATEFLKKVESYKQNELFGKSEQLEQLAEENTKQIVCSWYDYCKDCMNENYRRIKNMCHPAKWATQAYIDGYREAEKNEIHILESMEIKRLVKENEELKDKLSIIISRLSGCRTESTD